MNRGRNKRVLVVDDDEGMRTLLDETLTSAGYECTAVQDGLRALSHLASNEAVDLVFSDIGMPGISGIDLLQTVKAVTPTTPVILVSGLYRQELGLSALLSGAADYLFKPVRPKAILEMVQRHLGPQVGRDEIIFQERIARLLSTTGGGPLDTAQVLEVFETLGLKRYETLQHSRRVADYSRLVGRRLGLNGADLEDLRLGSLLHDVGKIAIPHNILMKDGPLNDEEWAVMRLHPELGWEMLRPFPELANAAQVVRSHHERFEGGGYPQGLAGTAIPKAARIFAVVDTYDAMVSDRPYRKGRPIDAARAEIGSLAGVQFDPDMVRAFLEIPELSLLEVRRRHEDWRS
jgi:putative nucleotidyltransferase with HDIG domain